MYYYVWMYMRAMENESLSRLCLDSISQVRCVNAPLQQLLLLILLLLFPLFVLTPSCFIDLSLSLLSVLPASTVDRHVPHTHALMLLMTAQHADGYTTL